MAQPLKLTRTHRILIGVVIAGAIVIAGIGFAGSYAAVRELALAKGFGNFSYVFPIGIDAGICVLLALDLLLTWIRIPFPLLRQTAWLLTLATIAFNGAAAWPDPLGVGMHSVIPVLFVVSVEAARHAIGRIADITADKHMEGVRLTRWLLSPLPTFLLWRRMKLWELRSYDQVIRLEQDRLVYQARLRSRFGRAWRRKAPVESLMPLRLARYGVPLAETAPAGLAAAGIEPAVLPAAEVTPGGPALPSGPSEPDGPSGASGAPVLEREPDRQLAAARSGSAVPAGPVRRAPGADAAEGGAGAEGNPWFASGQQQPYEGGYDPSYAPDEQYGHWWSEDQQGRRHPVGGGPGRAEPPVDPFPEEAWPEGALPAPRNVPEDAAAWSEPPPGYVVPEPPRPGFRVPAGPNQMRPLGHGTAPADRAAAPEVPGAEAVDRPDDLTELPEVPEAADPAADDRRRPTERRGGGFPEGVSREDAYYQVFRQLTKAQGGIPTPASFGTDLRAAYEVEESDTALKRYVKSFGERLNAELTEDHIA
ncbi:DUF2637 domain-containing protein [Streptomyces sp. LE64]|uniref:DUF2637 domain-containing protein n=1 Tax=Streptomyces sp. LE64 TaxID=3448653 RepID=UPI0040435F70